MTTVADDSPLAGYFDMDPLMGGLGDPFAGLSPEEYGDQSRWDDDDASFTDSDDDSEDDEGDDDCSHGSRDDEGEWNIVYAASFTVVASTSEPNGSPSLAAARRRASGVPDPSAAAAAVASMSGSNMPPPLPAPEPIIRRDSKVRFCDQPPKVVSYECCSREEYSQVYYSVHELQKIIDEVRLEKTTTNAAPHLSSATPPATNVALPSRSA